VMLIFGLLKIN